MTFYRYLNERVVLSCVADISFSVSRGGGGEVKQACDQTSAPRVSEKKKKMERSGEWPSKGDRHAVSFSSCAFGNGCVLRRLDESYRTIVQTFLQLTTSMARRKCRSAFW